MFAGHVRRHMENALKENAGAAGAVGAAGEAGEATNVETKEETTECVLFLRSAFLDDVDDSSASAATPGSTHKYHLAEREISFTIRVPKTPGMDVPTMADGSPPHLLLSIMDSDDAAAASAVAPASASLSASISA